MRTVILIVVMSCVGLVGCKKKQPADKSSDNSAAMSGPAKAMGVAADVKGPVGMEPDKRTAPRPVDGSNPPAVTGSKPVAGLEHAAFVPADAIAYGSFDAQKMMTAAKPIVLLFGQLRAADHAGSTAKKAPKKQPKLTYETILAMAKSKYGVDLTKLGRVTLIAVVPQPQRKRRAAFFSDPVFLASAGAFAPGTAKPLEQMGTIPLYAPAGMKKRGRIAVVGKTVIFGSPASVKKVLAARLGKSPRLGAASSLAKTIQTMKALQPKVSSFLVLDIPTLRKQVSGELGAWEKELRAGAILFSDTSLRVVVHGKAKRLGVLSKMMKKGLGMANKALPMAQKQFQKLGVPAATKLLTDVKGALKKVTIKVDGEQLDLVLQASPVKVMTVAGMLGYFMLASRSSSEKPPSSKGERKEAAKAPIKPRPPKMEKAK